jgi:hypothetical protein
MQRKKIVFVWATPPVASGRWYLGLINLRIREKSLSSTDSEDWHDFRRHNPHISFRGVILWMIVGAFATYLLGAAAIFYRLETRSSVNRVAYLDLILPNRWDQLDRLRAEALVEQSREAFAAKRFGEGFTLLRMALARNPKDHATRLELARIHVAMRLYPQARKLLGDGRSIGYPGRAGIELALVLANDAGRPDESDAIIRETRERLQAAPDSPEKTADLLWLNERTVVELNTAKKQAEALAFAREHLPPDASLRRQITILNLLGQKDRSGALAEARAWHAAEPASAEPLRVLALSSREAGDLDSMEDALAKLQALDPASPDPSLFAIGQYHLANQPARVSAVVDRLLFRHGASEEIYPALADKFAEMRREDLLDQLVSELRDRGLSAQPVLWARVQMASAAADWPGVVAASETFQAEAGPQLDAPRAKWLEITTRLAKACIDPGDGVQSSVEESIATYPAALRFYEFMIESLLRADRPATARKILVLAEGPYPDSERFGDLRKRIDAAIAASTPAPAVSLPTSINPDLVSEPAFVAAVEARSREGRPVEALALFSTLRRIRPDWLADAEARVDAVELPLQARGNDLLRLQVLARSQLARDSLATRRLLKFARELHPEGRADAAILIVREILRRDPANEDALAQLSVWQPAGAQPAAVGEKPAPAAAK